MTMRKCSEREKERHITHSPIVQTLHATASPMRPYRTCTASNPTPGYVDVVEWMPMSRLGISALYLDVVSRRGISTLYLDVVSRRGISTWGAPPPNHQTRAQK